jgi:hypothetical protein
MLQRKELSQEYGVDRSQSTVGVMVVVGRGREGLNLWNS